MINRFILLRVVRGVTPLDHVAPVGETMTSVWSELCNDNPQSVTSVTFNLGEGYLIRLRRLTNYKKRGGVSNADLRRWIIANHYDAPGTDLVFSASFDTNTGAVTYTFLGQLGKRQEK